MNIRQATVSLVSDISVVFSLTELSFLFVGRRPYGYPGAQFIRPPRKLPYGLL